MASIDGHLLSVDALFRELPCTRQERWGLLKKFFSGWYGELGVDDGCTIQSICDAERRLGIALPTALREWYTLAGQRRSVWSCQDHFLQPGELRIEGDRLIICIESQAVVKWAIPLKKIHGDDPPVVVSDQCDQDHWVEETTQFSSFALSQMLMDVKFSELTTMSANGQATDESLVAITRNYQKLDFPDLHWPPHPTRLFGGSDLIIETDAETWIWVSGRTGSTFCSTIDLITATGVVWEQVRGL